MQQKSSLFNEQYSKSLLHKMLATCIVKTVKAAFRHMQYKNNIEAILQYASHMQCKITEVVIYNLLAICNVKNKNIRVLPEASHM